MLPFMYPLRSGLTDGCLLPIECTVAGDLTGAGTITVSNDDAVAQGVTVARDGVGKFTITVPGTRRLFFVGGGVLVASNHSGLNVYPESRVASTGVITIETAITPGTAADPATGAIVTLTALVKAL